MVSSDRFLSAVAIEQRIAFARSQCDRIFENPRERDPKAGMSQTRAFRRAALANADLTPFLQMRRGA